MSPYRGHHNKTCKCGYPLRHPMVSAVGDYTIVGWVLLLLGISSIPIHIRFACRRCGTTLDASSDPEIIAVTRLE